MRKGDIYLVDFGKSRDSFSFGKTRPVILFQTDKLNMAVEAEIYDYSLVVPLSTTSDTLTEEFRIKITKRELLDQDSFAVCSSVCFLHKKFFIKKLGKLTDEEIKKIEKSLKEVFDME